MFSWLAGSSTKHLLLMIHPSFMNFRAKSNTYDEVVDKVAQRLGVDDPSKIRLTPHNCYSQQPKPNPIKYRSVDHLVDMLIHYNQVRRHGLTSIGKCIGAFCML